MTSKCLDEQSGILYTQMVKLWPVVTMIEDGSFYNGSIYLDSERSTTAVDFKLRARSKIKHKKMFRCDDGQGRLEPKSFHKIGVRVAETAITDSELLLHLDGRRLVLKMQKSQSAEILFKPVEDEEKEREKSRWARVDRNLLRNLPIGVANCIRDGQRHNVRQRIFTVVYLLVQEMLRRLGSRYESETADTVGYFDVWEETNDPIDLVMDYVLFMLGEKSIRE